MAELRKLTGPQKAAVVMLAIGEARASKLFELMDDEEIKELSVVISALEDRGKLDAAGIQTLMRGIDKAKLGLALKGVTEPMPDLFLSNMSERAGKIMREDMDALGPVRLKDVDEAQPDICASAKDLADKGEIVLSGGEDELVY